MPPRASGVLKCTSMRVPLILRAVLAVTVVIVVAAAITAKVLDGGHRARPSAASVTVVGPPASATAATAPFAPAPTNAPCFGAASVSPGRPCVDRRLRTAVFPTPTTAAAAQRGEPCRRKEDLGLLRVCFWGTPEAQATRTVALIGDSHASHWRAAMQDVVRAKRWRAISISRAACPLTLAHPALPGRHRTLACMAWNRAVQRWVRAHRSISVVFTGAHRGTVVPQVGLTVAATRRLGYVKAWRALRRSGVQQIVVFRDTPRMTRAALRCVEHAAQAGLDAGRDCALARPFALPPDPLAAAAAFEHSPRIQIADLSSFFCGPRTCRPVIGGALVLRDVSHMTTTYSSTLGPALERTVDRLAASWR